MLLQLIGVALALPVVSPGCGVGERVGGQRCGGKQRIVGFISPRVRITATTMPIIALSTRLVTAMKHPLHFAHLARRDSDVVKNENHSEAEKGENKDVLGDSTGCD